ncbi:periplasmic binding protein-like I [Halteromyces radiatus]|uniref:periplasmic binding protein-like I n=1 Tax=Halteromyces radiatus TaxID=101107 RepID=UPI00221F9835|nr:periplasmic binding protein-like I [Halteromyces radiatus]KAI8077824.1 periplasmic binding protein-like I [Halteromyces radiatus]
MKKLLYSFMLLLLLLLFHPIISDAAPSTINQNSTLSSNTTTSVRPTYNIGILFPNASDVRNIDPALNNMIVTSEIAIQLAQQHIAEMNYLPDVQLNFTRYYSTEFKGGLTSWTTTRMIEDGINAVIGDMVSNITEISAGLTGLFQIPQCSCAASSLDLSDKANYPYFFRSMGNVVVYGAALMEWIRQMNWSMFALVYTDDDVGQQILTSMLSKSYEYNITPMTQIPLYDLGQDEISSSLQQLGTTGARIIIVADSNPGNQILILQAARSMGMLSKGWVWMLTNDLSEALSESIDAQDLEEFDGLMFISGLWNLTDVSAYNDLYALWQQQPIPSNYVDPSQFSTLGLSYNAPNAYSCAELLALGLNKALNQYPGGRQQGLLDLSTHNFNSTPMTPTFYNMNYTGPAGLMAFTATGDQKTGHFELQYMKNGTSVAFAEIRDGVYKPFPDVPILYLGSTNQWPADMATRLSLNPKSSEVAGLVIYVIASVGIVLCLIMFILIVCYRDLKMVLVSSPIFLCLQLLGISLSYISVILYVNKVSVATCIARQLTLVIGFILVIGSIIAKNYRVYRVFQNVFTLQASKLKSIYLLRLIGIFGLIALAPLIAWYALYPVVVTNHMVTMNTYCIICAYPTSNKAVDWTHLNIAELISAIVCFIMSLVSALLAWKTRRISSKWSESQQIGYVSYNTGLATIVAAPAFFLSLDQYQVAIYLKLAAILFSATFTFLVLFLPKMVFICKYMTTQHWFNFWRIYPHQHRHHHKQHDMDSDRYGSCSELTSAFRFETQSDSNAHNALVAKNLLDFTVKAHEGVLPVKKRARFHFMSIWQLKHVVVIPSKQTFMLMTTMGHKAEYHRYVSCQGMPRNNTGRFIFCVWTDKNIQLYFQVYDREALTRWVAWFNGEDQPRNNNDSDEQQYDDDDDTTDDFSRKRQKNKLPSISTLGAATFNAITTNNTSMATTDQNLESVIVPHSPVYRHQSNQIFHQTHTTSNVASPNSLADTYNFYGAPQQVYHKNDSNPISTFGAFHPDDQNSSTYSY